MANFFLTYQRSKKKTYFIILFTGAVLLCNAQGSTRDSIVRQMDYLKNQNDFSPKDTVYIDLVNKLGSELRFFNVDSLLLLSKEALQLSKAAQYTRGESMALFRIGDYYSDKGNKPRAIALYLEALEIAKKLPNPHLRLRIQNNLASEYTYNGEYDKALSAYLEGVKLAEDANDLLLQSMINENIAGLYTSQKDYGQALEFYKKVKKLNEKLGNSINTAQTSANLASLYADMCNYEHAMFNANSSITTFEKHNVIDWLAYAYEVKGKIYLKQEKYTWALHWYKQSDMLHSKIKDDRGKIDLYNGMAEAYLGLKKDSISETYAFNAYELSSEIKSLEGMQKCAGTLYKINKNKGDFANSLFYHEIYQKLTDTIARSESTKSLILLQSKLKYDSQQTHLIHENDKQLAKQQIYIYVSLLILLIFIGIAIMFRKNEKNQKNLNKQLNLQKENLEKREEELHELNETKDKLFSIIAHDLRGPIGALKGLLKLFKDGEIGKEEFLAFVPKLGDDIDHISFTLNNLLSWGQSQMKGSVTRPSLITLENLVNENINFLSEIAKAKSIKIVNKTPENCIAWSDLNQIDIVIRNLISNALKFTPNKGTITIGAEERGDLWEVFIQDTGVGMDKDTQAILFSKNANITTYGTNNEKGTGLGLALCKEMIEKNAGTIWVVSVPNIGSCFYFTVPKGKEKYRKAS